MLAKEQRVIVCDQDMNPASTPIRFTLSLSLRALLLCFLIAQVIPGVSAQRRSRALQNPTSGDPVSKILLLRIVRAEDERRWDDTLLNLFSARNANVRARAALAAGRIGNEDAVADLVRLMQRDDETDVRAMAAFALGEIESPVAADALLSVVRDNNSGPVRARAIEALGKIASALPKEQEARARELGAAILDQLTYEARRHSAPDRLTILLALTATLRAKPANAGPIVSEFFRFTDPRIRADAANTLARLKLNDGNERLRNLLVSDPDPIVRANAARVLGATEDKAAFESLLDRALKDNDQRVRVSAIRALASLKDERAAAALRNSNTVNPQQDNETLEVATTLGRILQNSENKEALLWLGRARERFANAAPETEIAYARISPSAYLALIGSGKEGRQNAQKTLLLNWRSGSSLAQGLGEIAALPENANAKKQLADHAQDILRAMLDYRNSGLVINTLVAVHSEYAIPDVLRAYAAFKPKDLAEVLRKHLKESDVVIRATAADLLGEMPPQEDNARALIAALPVALADKGLNDAALSILDSLGKLKTKEANDAIYTAFNSQDYLVRRKAVAVLKANGTGDFSVHIGLVQTRNATADYERALARVGKQINAVVTTSKGAFTIALLPDDAPLTVDNFIQLATRGYFGGITVHRVVPNFVIQDGDPRGDGNGGPGYQIRCEINEAPYNRGAVGMALSGKDTGGSQWFVTHSPQPHLDGGYTVFGNVVSGMEVVDTIVRGDVIRSISITESLPSPPIKRRR